MLHLKSHNFAIILALVINAESVQQIMHEHGGKNIVLL